MPRKTRSQGFAHVALIVAIVFVIAAVAFGGWYVWNKNKNDNKQADNTAQTDNTQSTDTQSDPTEGGKYLVISEWGVRFELPEELRGDVEYGIRKHPSGDAEASFEIGKIANLPDSNCRLFDEQDGSGKSGGIGVSVRRSSVELSPDDSAIYQSVSHLDNDWYYVAGMRDGCIGGYTGPGADSANVENAKLMVQAADALASALKSLEPIPQQ